MIRKNDLLIECVETLMVLYPKKKKQLTMYLRGYSDRLEGHKRKLKNDWYRAGLKKNKIYLVWSYQGYRPSTTIKRKG